MCSTGELTFWLIEGAASGALFATLFCVAWKGFR
jgi:hypothetical protein